ncbi:MAG: response regulator transcription factor [Acidimicrobiia bacterium]
MTEIRVLVVDDHDLLREGVVGTLSSFDDIEVVGQANNGEAAVRLVADLDPDVVVMDLVMPGGSGMDAIRKISANYSRTKVLALTSFTDGSMVRRAIEAGATSFLFKNVDLEDFANAVRMTAAGQSTLAPGVAAHLVAKPDSIGDLTQREEEVANLIAAGLSNADIARELHMSVFTAKNHVRNILMKLQVQSRTEAASLILNHRYQMQGGSWDQESAPSS